MKSSLYVSAAALAIGLAAAMPARAAVYIGLQSAGVNGGALTTVASDPNFATYVGSYGGFIVNSITVSDLTSLLDSTALDVSANHGELKVFVSATDQNAPIDANYISSLTSNLLPSSWSATLTTWLDPGNAAYAQTVALGANAFSTIGTDVDNLARSFSGPYSVTGIYDITAAGIGTSLLTIHVDANPIPEPGTLPLLGAALLAAGFLLRRRSTSCAA